MQIEDGTPFPMVRVVRKDAVASGGPFAACVASLSRFAGLWKGLKRLSRLKSSRRKGRTSYREVAFDASCHGPELQPLRERERRSSLQAAERQARAGGLAKAQDVSEEKVLLHIYDLGSSNKVSLVNSVLKPFGSGAFHCGIEAQKPS